MDKRDSDERPDEPAFDMDEEIDARNERLGRRAALPHPVYRPMHPSHAIILAALSAVVQLLLVPAQPWWSLIVIAIDVLVIYALTAHGKELREK